MSRILFFVAALLFLAGCSDDRTPEEKAQATCESRLDAAWMAQHFIKQRLKAPTTAKFPASADRDAVRVKYAGDCTHDVWSYVDAQNAFGVMIRTNYYIRVKNTKGTDNWKVIDIQM